MSAPNKIYLSKLLMAGAEILDTPVSDSDVCYIRADVLRAEIERRITDNTFGAKLELMDILACLDTIESGSSEIPNDLEEAARVHAHCPFTDEEGNFHEDAIDASAYWDFIAGAKWQKEQDNYDTIFHKGMMYYRKQMMEEGIKAVKSQDFDKIEKTIAGAFVKYGMDKQKEQMMEEAVEGEYGYFSNVSKVILPSEKLNLKEGDKVRVIVVREE